VIFNKLRVGSILASILLVIIVTLLVVSPVTGSGGLIYNLVPRDHAEISCTSPLEFSLKAFVNSASRKTTLQGISVYFKVYDATTGNPGTLLWTSPNTTTFPPNHDHWLATTIIVPPSLIRTQMLDVANNAVLSEILLEPDCDGETDFIYPPANSKMIINDCYFPPFDPLDPDPPFDPGDPEPPCDGGGGGGGGGDGPPQGWPSFSIIVGPDALGKEVIVRIYPAEDPDNILAESEPFNASVGGIRSVDPNGITGLSPHNPWGVYRADICLNGTCGDVRGFEAYDGRSYQRLIILHDALELKVKALEELTAILKTCSALEEFCSPPP